VAWSRVGIRRRPPPVTNFSYKMSEIRFEPRPCCYLCGKIGHRVRVHLEDKLFGAPGTWNFSECSDEACGLIWLDPMPVPEDLPKAYASYYTHDPVQEKTSYRRFRDLYREVKKAHLASALGYECESVNWPARLLSKLLLFFPERRSGIEGEVMFLPAQPGAKLLDVGCGSGERLQKMRDMGWSVSGIDFDETAVRKAKARGLDVSCGTIPGIWFPPETFDVVTMGHVIEHVPDPIAMLKECNRILRPGGRVVLSTPNSSSWGHKLFKKNWRGLEPPRHLHLFSTSSIKQTLRRAGFARISVRNFTSDYMWQLSLMLMLHLTEKSTKDFRIKISRLLAQMLSSGERFACMFNSTAGECLQAIAIKESLPARVITNNKTTYDGLTASV
jgi:2-polyprenyl-3-methyl-5-hydroxy-6-metoxy-1,4-benzoquinol methylase